MSGTFPGRSFLRNKLLLRAPAILLVIILQEIPCDAGSRSSDPFGTRARAMSLLQIPFVPNAGQFDSEMAFSATTSAGAVSVTHDGEIVYALGGSALTEEFVGGSIDLRAGTPTGAEVSYFLSADPKRWRSGLRTYDSVHLGEVWPGVEVSLCFRGDSAEKFFTLAPGASPALIRVQVGGAEGLRPGPGGILLAVSGEVEFSAPIAYQEEDGRRLPVSVAYVLEGTRYGFRLGSYDPALPVVIDPLLQSTYLGERSEAVIHDIAVHPSSGDIYLAGAAGVGFPGTSGGAQPNASWAVVARLNSALTNLIQATYVGGSGYQEANSLAIAPGAGDILVAGFTNSSDFPGTAGAAQPALRGATDAYVARLNASLTSLLRATYFGGSRTEDSIALALHPVTEDALITGLTFSTDLPGVTGGAQPSHAGGGEDAFVARLNTALTTLQQATYAGGSLSDGGEAVVVHPSNNEIFVTGFTSSTNFPGTVGGAIPTQPGRGSFVARFNQSLTSLNQATYLGGSRIDDATDLIVHPPSGDILVVGATRSPDFPGTIGGAQPAIRSGHSDAFAARFTSSLTTLIQATYLGGTELDSAFDVAIFPGNQDVLIEGVTASLDFPGVAGGAQPTMGGGSSDAFAARLSADLTRLIQATYLGGSSLEQPLAAAVSSSIGDVYVAGYTSSFDFPRTAGGVQESRRGVFIDAFVARLTGDLSAGGGQPGVIPTLSGQAMAALAVLLAAAGIALLRRGG